MKDMMHKDSVSWMVTKRVRQARQRFFEPGDFEAPAATVDRMLSRLASQDELIRVRRGLYWRGPKSLLGMTPPATSQILSHLLKGVSYGPSSYSAANALGLTSQVPARTVIAVSGRPPRDLDSVAVRFAERGGKRGLNRQHLNANEIAVLEVLESWEDLVEIGEDSAWRRLRSMIDAGSVRADALASVARTEPKVVRTGLERLGVMGTFQHNLAAATA